jgi:hypothetical protein
MQKTALAIYYASLATPTSTGMRNVLTVREVQNHGLQKRVQDDFHIPLDGLKWLNKYLADMLSILRRT